MAVSGAWTYTESGGNATITDYDTGVGGFSPTIPTELDTFPVTNIANNAMASKSLTAVTINHAVTLTSNAIANNGSMSVTINADVNTSSVSASFCPFRLCSIGANLTLGEGVTAIPSYLFYNSGVTAVSLPSTLTDIKTYAFSNNSIGSLALDHVVNLQGDCFANNGSMTVTISANITTSNVSTATAPFRVCTLGSGVTISAGVTTIDDYLFLRAGLTEITFPSSVVTVNTYVLYDNDDLANITYEAQETVTFGANILTASEPSPKGDIYGYDTSVETWAGNWTTYYNYTMLTASSIKTESNALILGLGL